MRLLICGGRNLNEYGYTDWQFREAMEQWCSIHGEPDVVIHGAASGFDSAAGRWAEAKGIPVEEYPADWDNNGKAAGYIRNQQMLDEGKPTVVLAFPGGQGTANMVGIAAKAGIEVDHHG